MTEFIQVAYIVLKHIVDGKRLIDVKNETKYTTPTILKYIRFLEKNMLLNRIDKNSEIRYYITKSGKEYLKIYEDRFPRQT